MLSKSCPRSGRSAPGCRLVMSALTVMKSNAWTKPAIIRCASLSERAVRAFATRPMGPPPVANPREKTPAPGFQTDTERAMAPYDLSKRYVNAWNPAHLFVIRAKRLASLFDSLAPA
jgi:hypothetical protein